jgi:hypothetical protein
MQQHRFRTKMNYNQSHGFRNNNARSRKIPGRLHPNDDNVAQARGPKIRPKLGVSCRRLPQVYPLHTHEMA